MNPDYIPGSTYRDAIELPGPTLMQRLLNHFSNWWGLWLIISILLILIIAYSKASYDEYKTEFNVKKNTISFLKNNNITNISVINTWDGNFQVGSGCLGKNFATSITGEVDGKYLEAATLCRSNYLLL